MTPASPHWTGENSPDGIAQPSLFAHPNGAGQLSPEPAFQPSQNVLNKATFRPTHSFGKHAQFWSASSQRSALSSDKCTTGRIERGDKSLRVPTNADAIGCTGPKSRSSRRSGVRSHEMSRVVWLGVRRQGETGVGRRVQRGVRTQSLVRSCAGNEEVSSVAHRWDVE